MSRTFRFSFEIALCALAACAPDNSTPDGDAGDDQFVAITQDFAGYESWQSYDLGGDDGGATDDAGCAHVANVPRVAFINEIPPHGSTSFPVGTIIVKEIHTGATPADWAVFGMVKRGGDYGAGSGCPGWEWYGLTDDDDGGTRIQWSGSQASGTDPYANCGPCAGCHSAAQTNDCVLAPEMSLSQW